MPSLSILSAPNNCSISAMKNQLQGSIQGTVANLKSSALSLKQAPTMALNAAILSSGIPANPNQLIQSISPTIAAGIVNVGKDAISNIGISAADLNLKKMIPFEIPKIPDFPALGEIGMYLGAGPKFIAEKVAEYTALVPPFIPNVPMNIGQIAAVASLISQMMKTNPSEFLKELLKSVQQDLLKELNINNPSLDSLLDNSGICNVPVLKDLQAGVNSLSQVERSVSEANSSILSSINQMAFSVATARPSEENQTGETDQTPNQVTTAQEGNTTVVRPLMEMGQTNQPSPPNQ